MNRLCIFGNGLASGLLTPVSRTLPVIPSFRFLPTAALGVGFLALLGGCGRRADTTKPVAEQRQPVEVTPLTRRDLEEMLNLVGSVAANESATIRPETAGLVRSIHFEEGQQVAKGQLLVKIDDAELKAQLAQSESAYRLAELNLARAEQLWQTKSNSMADVDRARSEFASAKSERDLLKVRLDRSEIRAPFEGVVGSRSLSPGDYVTSQSIITTIDDLSRLKIDFQVPERFAAKVRPGTRFKVHSQALEPGAPLTGEVYFVAAVMDRATRSSEVKGFVPAEVKTLKPGMFANVELVLEIRRGVLTVPEGAILTTTNGTQIVAVKGEGAEQTVEFIPVRTGLRTKGVVEVAALQGELAESRQIVASGVGALVLYPGTKIEPRPLVTKFQNAAEL